jgi:hypothetical protein
MGRRESALRSKERGMKSFLNNEWLIPVSLSFRPGKTEFMI